MQNICAGEVHLLRHIFTNKGNALILQGVHLHAMVKPDKMQEAMAQEKQKMIDLFLTKQF